MHFLVLHLNSSNVHKVKENDGYTQHQYWFIKADHEPFNILMSWLVVILFVQVDDINHSNLAVLTKCLSK